MLGYTIVSKTRFISSNQFFSRADPNDVTAYIFIDNFCALEKDEEILNIWGGNFALQAFTFVESDSDIFLHCEVCFQKTAFSDFE